MMIPQTRLEQVFSKTGLLAQKIPGFQPRQQQLEMAEAVTDAITASETLVCEAGTGTGKTWAYLVPTLYADCRVLISTGTRNLQDQLFHRDLPTVCDALGIHPQLSLLKGRSNYLCPYRLELALTQANELGHTNRQELASIQRWSMQTVSGDVSEASLAENTKIWPLVTSNADNCLGADCPVLERCYLAAARRQAQNADIVVVNHHLLCADLALKDGGFGAILPGMDCIIVDEAHQLPDVASSFFGSTLSSYQLLDLARTAEMEIARSALDRRTMRMAVDALRTSVARTRLLLGKQERRAHWDELGPDAQLEDKLAADIGAALHSLAERMHSEAGVSKAMDACAERVHDALARLQVFTEPADAAGIRWFETRGKSFRLHQTPLEVSTIMRGYFDDDTTAWILTSATLAVSGDFSHFTRRLGIMDPLTRCWDSPFDYQHQALRYMPRMMPLPADPDYNAQLARVIRHCVAQTHGRAFVLFTSHKAMQEVAAALDDLENPIFVQEQASKHELLKKFVASGCGVLLGTSSFWEGVDVPGAALSCVIIDRLPFAAPGDPVLAARIKAFEAQGYNAFNELQVPQAIIALKQGVGRLIRTETDQGILVICDPRLEARSYGRRFLQSLPAIPCTSNLHEVAAFMERADAECASMRK